MGTYTVSGKSIDVNPYRNINVLAGIEGLVIKNDDVRNKFGLGLYLLSITYK